MRHRRVLTRRKKLRVFKSRHYSSGICGQKRRLALMLWRRRKNFWYGLRVESLQLVGHSDNHTSENR